MEVGCHATNYEFLCPNYLGSGIGKACCIALAKEGAEGVLVTDIDLKSAEKTVAEATAAASNPDFRAEAIKLDVTLEDSVKQAVDHMVKSFGRIDYCVHSAGVSVTQRSIQTTSSPPNPSSGLMSDTVNHRRSVINTNVSNKGSRIFI